MAPSRRKGGGKASAAAAVAAARRQWKVGDLVLAKVKGFPAWPATVSEPEKWGYSADGKKVLVYFFGTQQIAFCNPIDVEVFTEEKKESLLTKRHGKGADFVRAVHEIIDCYEQLKKEGQVACNSLDDVNLKKTGCLEDNLVLQDQNGTPNLTLSSCVKTSYFAEDKKELSLPVEDAAVIRDTDILHDKETEVKEPVDNLVPLEKTRGNTYFSRRRLGRVQPKSWSSQKKEASASRSRSLSRVDVSRLEKCTLLPGNGSKAAADVPASLLCDGIRSKRIWKSPDASDAQVMDSPALPSKGSSEENGSDILTVDSEALSLNEGSTVDSGCKVQQPEPVLQCCDEIQLNQRSVLGAEAVIVKKKRKQSRKRVTSEASETTAKLDEDAGSEVEVHRNGQHCPDEKLSQTHKEDGDEHLPLVKRARVRMGRPSLAEEDLDILATSDGRSSVVLNKFSGHASTSLTHEEDSVYLNSSALKYATDNSLLPNKCSQSSVDQPQVLEVRNNAKLGSSVDGEAALPPSKRLHRALEAMSANAAEDTKSDAPLAMKTSINGCYSSTRGSPEVSMDGKGGNGFGIENVDSFSMNASQDNNSGISTSSEPPVPEERANCSAKVANCSEPISNNSSQENEFCEERALENLECDKLKILSVSSLRESTAEVAIVPQSPKHLSPCPGRQQACLECNQVSLQQVSPSTDICQDESLDLSNHKIEKPLNELDCTEDFGMVSDLGSGDVEVAKDLLAEGNCSATTKPPEFPVNIKNEGSQMYHVTGNIKQTLGDSDAVVSATTLKDIAAAEDLQHLSHSASFYVAHMGDKDISGTESPSSQTNRLGSPACESQPSTSICNDSVMENYSIVDNTGHCSLNSRMHHGKPKDVGKWSHKAEASAALASFEAALGLLTRTKDSIGRATRIAIDCAKFGNAAKVMEILARNLEIEPSLHRRVDLFFLVDSITQCSRGLKGNVGDIYPSAIQALLPRLLLAAAPPGSSAQENRRQCLKVLRLWLERKILPDSVIRHHIRDLQSFSSSSSGSAFSWRPLRTERPFDDPIREMEGMLVDEYGSNSSFQLAGFCMPAMLKDEDEGSDSDGGNFEAVTPEHECGTPEEKENVVPPTMVEKHTCVLEEVDGELEMEDVAPSCEAEMTSISNTGGDATTVVHHVDRHIPLPFLPPLPEDVPPSSPPLPTSPPPLPPQSVLPPPSAIPVPISSGLDLKVYMGAHSTGQGMGSMNSDVVPYCAPECGEIPMQPSVPDAPSSSSFSSLPVPHLPIRPVNGAQEKNGASLHNAAYPLRPPQPPPSNQFSYMHPDQRLQSQREAPHQSHPSRVHFGQGSDGGNFNNEFERRKLGLHEPGSSWRFPGPPVSGAYYPDCPGGSYGPQYTGPPCEPPLPNHGWGFSPWNMNHREFMPHRPPSEGPIPVAIRAPSFWQPR